MLKKIQRSLNSQGTRKKCNVCNNTFNTFKKFKGGRSNLPKYIKMLDMVGSDIDNFECIKCRSFDRERHLFMYFEKLNMWSSIKGKRILHFAPEYHLSKKIQELNKKTYIMGDLFPKSDFQKKIDITNIPYKDNSFDLLLANHILEHVPDYRKALREIYRVLDKGGEAILQTPYSRLLQKNFEDINIVSEEQRAFFYGQHNHVRIFGESNFYEEIKNVGFKLACVKHNEISTDQEAFYFGVNSKEDLVRVFK